MALRITDEAARLAAEVIYVRPLTAGKRETAREALQAALPHLVDDSGALPALETRQTLTERHEYELWRDALTISAINHAADGDVAGIQADAVRFHGLLKAGPPA